MGVLPSQLDSIRLLARALGVDRLAFVDGTVDGVFRYNEWERFGSLAEWLDQVEGPIYAFRPSGGSDVRYLKVPEDAWVVFCPAMGFGGSDFVDQEVEWASIPVGADLNSRDAIPIALWELAE